MIELSAVLMNKKSVLTRNPLIVITTINASYQHCSFGLRYLYANLGDLQTKTRLLEYTIHQNARTICEELLDLQPKIIGFGVYIWNAEETLRVVSILKKVAPHIKIVLGGPEISYETESQRLYHICDHVICGEADFAFPALCHRLLQADSDNVTAIPKLIAQALPDIKNIQLPYRYYSDEDIANRVIYVEASRGCPYKCEYCLSSLDKSVRSFELDLFLNEMDTLIERGVRQFKFVDRTFNLSIASSTKILHFFLQRIHVGLFLHFEMVPDRLPDELKLLIAQFPQGSLQFEIGIQTLNPTVAHHISRRNDLGKAQVNFEFLHAHHVHTHADLIVGLPGETFESFGTGFDRLLSWRPHEVQVGILKRLKGTPIARHESTFCMMYSEHQPYEILSNRDMSFKQIQFMQKFAKFWDLYSNSGKFAQMLSLLFANENSFFQVFVSFVEHLELKFSQTYAIHQDRLFEALFDYLVYIKILEKSVVVRGLALDLVKLHPKGHVPSFLKNVFLSHPQLSAIYSEYFLQKNLHKINHSIKQNQAIPIRQKNHLQTAMTSSDLN